jgi:hypothetical protein
MMLPLNDAVLLLTRPLLLLLLPMTAQGHHLLGQTRRMTCAWHMPRCRCCSEC